MNACILAVGSEMLTPFRVDTNSLVITERLNTIGYDVRLKAVVADHADELVRVLEGALSWADLIVVTGGLGPTEDDITRDAVARVLATPMSIDERIVATIQERFARRGMKMAENNRRQAMVPRGAEVLENAHGTAPGLWLTHGRGTAIALLPGPPREMTPMLDAIIRDRLAPKSGGAGLFRRVLKITGRPESEVDAIASPVYGKWTTADVPIATTILAALGQIELHLTARAPNRAAAEAALDEAVKELQAAIGVSIYGTDGRPLEAVLGEMLRERKLTIAVAESCTGGLLASRLTDVPGSSAYVDRGVVCYSDRSKTDLLGVPPELIEEHGAVSEPVARAMADGIRSRAGTNVGVGITGIAGPDGGTAEKPVGTVAIAVVCRVQQDPAHKADEEARVRTFQFIGGRDMVKFQSAQAAMNMLRLMLLKSDAPFWPAKR
ncbi:MAG TPA: competence/damage-inducible protein A [Vicinamibacterales bacterium]|nr:competence/damage-inducible protein A [Vicinamibacterales bacterium]